MAPISPIPPLGSPHFYATPNPCGYNSPGYLPAPQNTPMTPYAVANWNGIFVPAGHQLAQPTDLDNEVGPVAPRNSSSAMAVMTNNGGRDTVRSAGSPGCHLQVARARKSAMVYRSSSVSESMDSPSTPRNKNMVKTAVMGSYMHSQTDVGRGSNDLNGRPGDVNSSNHLRSPFLPHPLYKTRPCNKYNEHTGCPYADRCLFRHPGGMPTCTMVFSNMTDSNPPTPLSGSESSQQRFFAPGTPGRAPQQSPFFSHTGRYPRPRGQPSRGLGGTERVMNLDTVSQALDLVEKRGPTALKRYNSELSLGQHTYSQLKEFGRRGQGESEQQ
ncbi:hypothetical protein AAVH_03262 [Aphelenchoides avenae]|nr:hypothetical protein AAVH_03262 [Aphelenchus avenae]